MLVNAGDGMRWRALRPACCCGGGRARGRGGEQGTAKMKAETVRDQVEIKASRRLHAAASTAHERHAAGVTCRGGQRGETASGRRRRSSGRGPGRGGARARAREWRGPFPVAGRNRGGGLLRVGFEFPFSYFQLISNNCFQISF
jgi:hypothetical protein